jgi:hypothetical protein
MTRTSLDGSATAAWAIRAFNREGPSVQTPVAGVQKRVKASAFAWVRGGPSELKPPIMTIRPSGRVVAVCQACRGACGAVSSPSQRWVCGFQMEALPPPKTRIRPSGWTLTLAPPVPIPGAGPASRTACARAVCSGAQRRMAMAIVAASRALARKTVRESPGTDVQSRDTNGRIMTALSGQSATRFTLVCCAAESSSRCAQLGRYVALIVVLAALR